MVCHKESTFAYGTNDAEADYRLVEQYMDFVNEGTYSSIVGLFNDKEAKSMEKFFSDKSNYKKSIGIYNVEEIIEFTLQPLDSVVSEVEYGEYEELQSYLLMLDCSVKKSNQFFMEGKNYFQLVTGIENGERKILELSVADISHLEDKLSINLLSDEVVEDFSEYEDQRSKILLENCGFKQITMEQEEILGLARANYSPTKLSSYAFPSSIRVLNTSTNKSSRIDFRTYCYVVSASEFAVGTDGVTKVNGEALKAFSLCVRNFGWYRCLYPYKPSVNADVTDDTNTQTFKWSIYNSGVGKISQQYPQNVQKMSSVWNVMMFDSQKKLFLPPYRAGSYKTGYLIALNESNFSQNGANYYATKLGKNYQQILHYYYDNAKGTLISKGNIIICSGHTMSGAYYTSSKGHAVTCKTCGYFSSLSSHSYKVYNGIVKCSVCGYKNS